MSHWPLRVVLIVVVAGAAGVLLPGLRRTLRVDRCLDRGGAYDHATDSCRTDVQTLPVKNVPLVHIPDRGSTVVALAIAMALARLFVLMDRRRKTRQSSA